MTREWDYVSKDCRQNVGNIIFNNNDNNPRRDAKSFSGEHFVE